MSAGLLSLTELLNTNSAFTRKSRGQKSLRYPSKEKERGYLCYNSFQPLTKFITCGIIPCSQFLNPTGENEERKGKERRTERKNKETKRREREKRRGESANKGEKQGTKGKEKQQ